MTQIRLALDAEADELLAEQGLQVDAVPEAGREVLLRRKANISAGGTHRLVDPSQVHPDNLLLAQRAAALLRLDLAGIDLISIRIRLRVNSPLRLEESSRNSMFSSRTKSRITRRSI